MKSMKIEKREEKLYVLVYSLIFKVFYWLFLRNFCKLSIISYHLTNE